MPAHSTPFTKTVKMADEFVRQWPGSEFGPGHIVLADSNFEDHHLLYCMREAYESLRHKPNDPEMIALIDFLLKLSELPDEARYDEFDPDLID